jgi:diguanylate cyclase (GGDEF)-like protein
VRVAAFPQSDRTIAPDGTNRQSAGRLAAFLFLVVVAANAATFPFIGAGPWWTSPRFWLGRVGILLTAVAGAWSIREREHRRRARLLESSVAERTQALERESHRELERNRILEMLVSDKPLGTVLDCVIQLMLSHFPGYTGALVRKCGDHCEILAAPDLSGDWRAALEAPHAVPFETWREYFESRQPGRSPAWANFLGAMRGAGPVAIHSWPVGSAQTPLGALLLFQSDASALAAPDRGAAGEVCHLARLALEHSRLNDDLHFQARHDSITRLPNRAQYEERLRQALREAETHGRRLAVLNVDLDNFKGINDRFSHRVGDLLLGEVASRIQALLPEGDTVARIGGDEFSIVLNGVEDGVAVARTVSFVLEAVRQPFLIDGQRVEASASAGIAIFPEDGEDLEQLERAAGAAMYHAKDLGRDRAEAFATRNEKLDRVRMEEEIRLGLRHGWFVVHYQAKVGADRKVVGFEALVRMKHPQHGLIPPMNFVPIAEASGLIVALGSWVLEEVCRQMADWEQRGLGQVPVAVNVSPAQICRPDFARSVEESLERHGVAAWNIELELTEGLLINPTETVQRQIRELRALGVQLSIDDFGTGYSSLSYLHRLQIDSIKLDRSFVQSIDTDDLSRRLVQAMMGVAQGLGLSAVAEGVETEAQRTTLLGAGCRVMQGYLFAKPKPASELEELLRTSAWEHALPHAVPAPDSADLIGLSASISRGNEHLIESIRA